MPSHHALIEVDGPAYRCERCGIEARTSSILELLPCTDHAEDISIHQPVHKVWHDGKVPPAFPKIGELWCPPDKNVWVWVQMDETGTTGWVDTDGNALKGQLEFGTPEYHELAVAYGVTQQVTKELWDSVPNPTVITGKILKEFHAKLKKDHAVHVTPIKMEMNESPVNYTIDIGVHTMARVIPIEIRRWK